MIWIKTPLRVSFVWWGSDLPSFYKEHWWAVVSTAIDKWVHIFLNKNFHDDQIRFSYSRTENVWHVAELEHQYAKEILKMFNIQSGVEIVSMADIPWEGSWLWSSSSFSVALIHALHEYTGNKPSAQILWEQSCDVEIVKCWQKIGKQDQYAAAYGWLNFIEFNKDDTVKVSQINIWPKTKEELERSLVMFYTWITRKASSILEEQSANMTTSVDKVIGMQRMVQLAYDLRDELERNNISAFWEILNENRELKKQMSSGIAGWAIDEMYDRAMKAWAEWWKLLWAWGWGFLLFYANPDKHDAIEKELWLKRVQFKFDEQWSRLIHLYK